MKKLFIFHLFLATNTCLFSQLYIPSGETFAATGNVIVSVREDSLKNEGDMFLNNADLYVSGHFSNAGNLQIGTSTVILDGNSLQKITSGGIVYNILEIHNTGAGAELKDDIAVNGQLNFSSGLLNTTTAHTLTLNSSATVSGEHNGSYAQGTITTVRNVDGTSPVTFGNMGVIIDPMSQNLGNVSVTRRSGLQTLNYSYFYGDGFFGNKTIDRVWDIDAQNPPVQKVDLTLEWLSINNNGVNIASAQTIYHNGNGLSAWQGTSLPFLDYSTTLSSTVLTNHFSKWSIADNIDGVLSATLLSFTANLNEKSQTVLEWATEKELNCDHFEVERSLDNASFAYFSTIKGHGTTHTPQNYKELDKSPALGYTYYRLKQVDTDGAFHYSRSVNVFLENNIEPYISVFPNPSNGHFTIELSSNLLGKRLTITDAIGQEILKTKVESTLFNLDIEVAKGIYFLNFSTDSGIHSKKIVVE